MLSSLFRKPDVENSGIRQIPVYNERRGFPPFSVFSQSKDLNHRTDVFQDSNIDMNYFEEQKTFLKSLTKRETDVLQSYTIFGDEIINGLLRGRLPKGKELFEFLKKRPTNFPFIRQPTESNSEEIVTAYVKEFSDIFERVPPLKKRLRLFRGIRPVGDSYIPGGNNFTFKSPTTDYMSTTYTTSDDSMLSKFFFEDEGEACCLMEMIVEPGVKALWIEPISNVEDEREIIIENGVAFYNGCIKIKNESHTEFGDNDNYEGTYKNYNITVYEYTIKPYKSWMASLGEILVSATQCLTRKRKRNGGKRSDKRSDKRSGGKRSGGTSKNKRKSKNRK